MFWKKDKSEEGKLANMILKFVIILSVIALLIAGSFRMSPYGNELKIGDYLSFAGAFGGAILGAMMSLMILTITIKNQKKDLEEQRKIDDDSRDEERKRFERSHNIQIINDKLNFYMELFELTLNLVEEINKIIPRCTQVDKDKINYRDLLKLINRFEFLGNQIVDENLYKFYQEIINKIYEFKESINKINVNKLPFIQEIYNKLKVFSENLIDMSKKLSDKKYN